MSDGSGLGSWGTSESTSYPGDDSWGSSSGIGLGSTNDPLSNWGTNDSTDYPGSDSWGDSGVSTYNTGGWDDPNSDQYVPPKDGSGSIEDPNSFWNRAKRTLFGWGIGQLGERAGIPGSILNGVISGLNAPEGKGLQRGADAFGGSIVNGIVGAIPGVGLVNTISGFLGGPTAGSMVTNNRGDGPAPPATSTGRGGANSMTSNFGVGNIIGGLAGLYNYNNSQRNLGNQINSLQGLYGQDSPYAQTLRQQLSRRDAAAGRRSQYGPREVELQARLAQMASGQSGMLNQLQNQQMQMRTQGLGQLLQFGRQSGLFDRLQGGLSGMFNSGASNYNDFSNPDDFWLRGSSGD